MVTSRQTALAGADFDTWLNTLQLPWSPAQIEVVRRACLLGDEPDLAVADLLADLRMDHEVVAAALLHGGGDYSRTIGIAVMGGLDTDCNGATVGSIIGMMLDIEALPSKWTSVMNDTIHTGLAGYHACKISHLSEAMFELHRTVEKT